jgi:hypothetical protein
MLKKNISIIIRTRFRNHIVVYLKKNALEITLDSRSATQFAALARLKKYWKHI